MDPSTPTPRFLRMFCAVFCGACLSLVVSCLVGWTRVSTVDSELVQIIVGMVVVATVVFTAFVCPLYDVWRYSPRVADVVVLLLPLVGWVLLVFGVLLMRYLNCTKGEGLLAGEVIEHAEGALLGCVIFCWPGVAAIAARRYAGTRRCIAPLSLGAGGLLMAVYWLMV